jgi:hypothetical protein
MCKAEVIFHKRDANSQRSTEFGVEIISRRFQEALAAVDVAHAKTQATLKHLQKLLGRMVSRIAECPECGHAEVIGQDWLADHGAPVCNHCDCDMQLV